MSSGTRPYRVQARRSCSKMLSCRFNPWLPSGARRPEGSHGLKRQLSIFEQLRRACTRYGLVPEDIGPISTFTDDEYMRCYIGHLRGFEAPASYGVSAVHRERAQRAWRKVITKVRTREAPEGHSSKPQPQRSGRKIRRASKFTIDRRTSEMTLIHKAKLPATASNLKIAIGYVRPAAEPQRDSQSGLTPQTEQVRAIAGANGIDLVEVIADTDR